MIAAGVVVVLAAIAGISDEAVSPADYPRYREALRSSDEPSAPAVTFAQLWNDSETYQGRRLAVIGRIERRFRQPAVGEFPALTEAWLVDDRGNPLCVVFPSREPPLPLGQSVRFTGTFLRRIRYPGGDADRLAPLLVGPAPPRAEGRAGAAPRPPTSWVRTDWVVGLALAALVVAVLGAQHLRLKRAPRRIAGPPPRFLDANEGAADGEEGTMGGTGEATRDHH